MNTAPFRSRIKLVSTLRSGIAGLLVGGVLATVLAGLMLAKLIAADAKWLVLSLGSGLVLGLVRGAFLRVGESDILRSIDRRAELEDRLTTSAEVSQTAVFAQPLTQDAQAHFGGLKPKALFPWRWSRRDLLVPVPALLAAGLYFFASMPVHLTAEQKQEQVAMKRAAVEVERLAKPLTQPESGSELTAKEQQLAKELNKLQQDMKTASIEKQPALQKLNELGRDSEVVAQDRNSQSLKSLENAQAALAKTALGELSKPDSMMSATELKNLHARQEKMAAERDNLRTEEENLKAKLSDLKKRLENNRLSREEREKLSQEAEKLEQQLNANQENQRQLQAEYDAQSQSAAEMQQAKELLEGQEQTLRNQKSALQKQLSEVEQKLKNSNLSPEQRKALEDAQKKLQEALKGLEKELAEVQKAMQDLMDNEKIREMMEKLNSHPDMQKLREMMAEMQQNAEAQEAGETPTLTKEDLEEMKKKIAQMKEQLEKLAKQLEDPKALEEFIKALEEAIKNQELGSCASGLCMGLPNLLNLPGLAGIPGMPSGMYGEDKMLTDTGTVKKSDRNKDIKANAATTAVKGRRSEQGAESYIEVRGPTSVGNRTSVPYSKVLPSYRQRAEQAMKNQKIPKQHEKRVKAYFDSLAGKK